MRPTLRRDDQAAPSEDVKVLQTRLNVHGAALAVDGRFGARTYTALVSFQVSRGLVQHHGIADPATWAALEPAIPTPPITLPTGRVEVARTPTPLTEAELRQALIDGHLRFFRSEAPPHRIGVAWAQQALESGRGAKVIDFNLGNITAGSHYPGPFYILHVPPPDPPMLAFEAHADPIEGAVSYWRLLVAHYPRALGMFDRGDAHDAGVELGERGYYLDPRREGYGRSMASLYAEYGRTWPKG